MNLKTLILVVTILSVLAPVLSVETTAKRSSSFKKPGVFQKKQNYEDEVQKKTERSSDEDKATSNFERFTRAVYSEIEAASGIAVSNVDKIDFRNIRRLVSFKLKGFNANPEFGEEGALNTHTDDIRCASGISTILVPEESSLEMAVKKIEEEQAKSKKNILEEKESEEEADERDFMTEEELEREAKIFTAIYDAHRDNIDQEIKAIQELLKNKKEEEEKSKMKKALKTLRKAGNGALFVSQVKLKMMSIFNHKEGASNIKMCR